MNLDDYLKQNDKGFEGDSFLKAKFEEVCKNYDIDTIIETGTYRGATTVQLAKMCNNVHTIEINEANFNEAKKRIDACEDKLKIRQIFGSSEDVLDYLVPCIGEDLEQCTVLYKKLYRIFFFLDAHWGDYNPLLDELKILAQLNIKPVIAIHDFYNPNHPDYGFDTYEDGKLIYDYAYIEKSLEVLYNGKLNEAFTIEYNGESEGAKRGVIFIYPIYIRVNSHSTETEKTTNSINTDFEKL